MSVALPTVPENYDPTPMKSYTEKEWDVREAWYIQETNKLNLPIDATPHQIREIEVGIDKVLSIAAFDFALYKNNADMYERQKKYEERRLFVTTKTNPPAGFSKANGKELTIPETESVVANVMLGNAWANTKKNIFQLIDLNTKRYLFVDNVIRLLRDKKDLLITYSAMMKIENNQEPPRTYQKTARRARASYEGGEED